MALESVLLVALILRVPSALSRASLGYDDGVYLASVMAMRRGAAPFEEVYSSQGPAFLPILRAGDLVTRSASWGPRVAPVIAGLACAVIAYRLAARVADRWSAVLAAGLTATSGALLFSTTRIESDGIAAALGAGAVLCACGRGRVRVVGAGLIAGLALAVKSLLVVPAVAAMVVLLWRRSGPSAAFKAMAAAIAVVAALFVLWGWQDVWTQFVGLHLRAHGHVAMVDRVAHLRADLWQLDRLLVALVIGAALWAAVTARRRPRREPGPSRPDPDLTAALLVWFVSAVVVLLLHAPLFTQHLTVVVLPAAVLVARFRPPWPVVGVLVLVLVQGHAAGAGWRLSGEVATPTELAMVGDLRRLTPEGSLLVTDAPTLGWMADRGAPGWLVDPSHVRIDADELTTAEVMDAATAPGVCAVLFWSGRLDDLTGLRKELASSYHSVVRDGGHELLLRDDCTAGSSG